ncbi:winged helix-turn-helix domain-containing protein [Granulicella paludicola]|uniref:winged helix-turn-helix domain-containing protein n=1 Tax=Granulicella paludicola TaxID=474951 RepID=UPI0021DFA331|nr:winged helix-turn-helix domain-containing protein [Granulicella paludicola]
MTRLGNNSVQFEGYEIDRARWQLSWRDEPIPLNRKTFDVLLYLVDHADRVVSKDELLRTLWAESFVEESNLTQHIFLLRKALSRHTSGTKIIETVAGRGYRFAAAIQEQLPTPNQTVVTATQSVTRITIEEEMDTPESAFLFGNVTQPPLAPLSVKRRIYWIAGASIVVLSVCAAGWLGWEHWLDRSGGAPVQVVLVPIEGTTGDAILDKSLTQALRMDLAQSPYVSVVPDSTVQATLTQMMHKPGDVMTPAMARELCERTNSQGVLSGNIAKVGQHFLITEEASNCVDGLAVASAKYEADKPEDLPRSIDRIAASLRRKLGESRRSIARFDTPLLPGNTASLEALKDYTQALLLANQGKFADAITLLKSALQLDPNFAAARYSLAVYYLSTNDFVNGREAVMKAYEVKDTASEPVRLAITAFYETYSTQDLFAAARNFRSWTELYPHSVQAWNGLYIVQRDLGHHADAAASGLKALALMPINQALYEDAAFGQMTSGDLQGARATLDSAIAHKLDGDRIRSGYFKIAVLLQDPELLRTQQTWIEAHPEAAYCRMEQAYMAIEEGRFDDARRQLEELTALLRQQGLSGLADAVTKSIGMNLIEAGDRENGIRVFRSVPLDPEDGDDLVGLAEAGDFKTAEADLQALRSKYPQGTLSRHYFGPLVEANSALANHHAQQAIALMEATRPLDDRDLYTRKFRGDLYRSTGQFSLAEKEYRAVIAHREIESESVDYTLSWLGLGETLASEGDRAAAIDAYQHFFALWAHADPYATYLKQAKQEFATLQTGTLAR